MCIYCQVFLMPNLVRIECPKRGSYIEGLQHLWRNSGKTISNGPLGAFVHSVINLISMLRG